MVTLGDGRSTEHLFADRWLLAETLPFASAIWLIEKWWVTNVVMVLMESLLGHGDVVSVANGGVGSAFRCV